MKEYSLFLWSLIPFLITSVPESFSVVTQMKADKRVKKLASCGVQKLTKIKCYYKSCCCNPRNKCTATVSLATQCGRNIFRVVFDY